MHFIISLRPPFSFYIFHNRSRWFRSFAKRDQPTLNWLDRFQFFIPISKISIKSSWSIFIVQKELCGVFCSVKKVFLEISQNSQEHLLQNTYGKETQAQVFSWEFYVIFWDHLFYRTSPVAFFLNYDEAWKKEKAARECLLK